MCVWRACALGALLLLLRCSESSGTYLTPAESENRIRYGYDTHLVIKAIRANTSLFLNHRTDSYNTTLLIYAAYYYKDNVVEELINQGADVNAQNTKGETALTEASKAYFRGKEEFYYRIVELLLDAGANVSLPEAPARSALHQSAYAGEIDISKALISADADLDRQDSSGHTPLMLASQQRNYVVLYLLRTGANPDFQDSDGNTALMLAIRNLVNTNFGNHLVVQQLIDAGADVELPPAPKWGPLHYAASRGLHYTIEKLIAAGANVSRMDSSGKTPLLIAADQGEKVVEVLLEGGSDVDHQDDNGDTALLLTIKDYRYYHQRGLHSKNIAALLRANASVELPSAPVYGPLHHACSEDYLFAVKILIETGADLERLDNRGRTPLLVAADKGSHSLRLLVNAGANVNHQDDNGDTALTLLIKGTYTSTSTISNRSPLIQSLLDAEANVSLPAEPAWSPLHRAVERGLSYMVEALIKSGANVNRLDSEGRTPLIIACDNVVSVATGIVQMLIDAGADVDIQDAEGNTALSRCMEKAYHGSSHTLEEVVSLLNASASVHLPAAPARSPLHYAASNGQTYYIKRLIEAGADVNRTDSQGMTPLLNAASSVRLVVKELIKAGSDVNHLANDGETALIKACKNSPSANRDIVVDYLLAAGADPNRNFSTIKTALHWAVDYSSPYVVKRLMMYGASSTAVDGNGYTPLMYMNTASNTMRPDLIKVLVAYGSNIDHLSYTDGTLLHRLANYGDHVSLKTAVRFCPNLSLTNDEGSTPEDIARRRNYHNFIAALSDDYRSLCIHNNELYNEGEHRCDTNGAYLCLHDCSWTTVNPSTVNCPIVLSVVTSQGNIASTVEQIGTTHHPYLPPTSEAITFSTYLSSYMPTTGATVNGPSSLVDSTEVLTEAPEPASIPVMAHRIKKREDDTRTRENPSSLQEALLGRQITEESSTFQCSVTCIKEDEDGDQVCGTDGITYAGDCELARESCGQLYFSKSHDGACSTENCDISTCSGEEYNPVCGSDHQTYDNRCKLDAIRACNFPSLTAIGSGTCEEHASVKGNEDDPDTLVNVGIYVNVR